MKVTKLYLEPSRTPEIEVFAKIVNGIFLLHIFTKSFIVDDILGSEYASDLPVKYFSQLS